MDENDEEIFGPFHNGVRVISGCHPSVQSGSRAGSRSMREASMGFAPRPHSTEFANSVRWPEAVTNAAPERLRWIADFLDVADKAIAVIACVQGFDYSSECQRGAQQDLRRWAHWLEARPGLAAGLAVARLVPGPEVALLESRPRDVQPESPPADR